MEVGQFLHRLEKARPNGKSKYGTRQYKALCPAHADRNPSLSICTGPENQLLVKCFAGCSTEDIVGALGLTLSDLFNDVNGTTPLDTQWNPHAEGTEAGRFRYEDASGEHVLDVIRYHHRDDPTGARRGKKYVQQAADGSWTTKHLPRIPYRLPQVLEAIQAGRTVLVVEGEKCADFLTEKGFVATTNREGAGKWTDEESDNLQGGNVILIGDNDTPGQRHIVKAGTSLVKFASVVRVLSLPGLHEHGDVVDWFERGGTEAEFGALLEEAEPFVAENSEGRRPTIPDSRSLIESGIGKVVPLWGFSQPPPMEWYVSGFIPEGYVTILAAHGGMGKSYLSIHLSLCIALGKPFFGRDTKGGRVLYVDYELDEAEQKRRVWRVAQGMGYSVDAAELVDRLYYYRPPLPLGEDQTHDEVLSLLKEFEIDFVVLDSLTLGAAGSDVKDSTDTTMLMRRFRDWGTVLAIDHISSMASKGNHADAPPFGSVFKYNLARSTATLTKVDGGGYMINMGKANFSARSEMITYKVDFEPGQVTFSAVDVSDESMQGCYEHMRTHDITYYVIEELYKETGRGVEVDEIVERREELGHGISKKTVQNQLTTLERNERIERDDSRCYPVSLLLGGRESGMAILDDSATFSTNGQSRSGMDRESDRFETDEVGGREVPF